MSRVLEQILRGCNLHNLSEIHHRDPIADMPHDRKVVRNEERCQSQFPLQFSQKIEDLCADRNVERRDGFIAYQKIGLQSDGPRNTDALALPAGKLGGKAIVVFGIQTNQIHKVLNTPRSLSS